MISGIESRQMSQEGGTARVNVGSGERWASGFLGGAWRSLAGAPVPNAGSVRFILGAADRGTEVHVVLDYILPAGRIGWAVAKLFGEEPRQQVQEDLRRFKQFMETGEVPTAQS